MNTLLTRDPLSLVQLFLREQKASTLVDKAFCSPQEVGNPEFVHWLASKRPLVLSDVVGRHWIKTCTAGYITELVFAEAGTLCEYRLFDRFATHGFWTLTDGALDIEIIKGDNRYQFTVVANAAVNIHSAVEHKNGELHSYLKFAQVEQ